jgi:hypothetical protein
MGLEINFLSTKSMSKENIKLQLMKAWNPRILGLILLASCCFSCKKAADLGEDPYAGGKASLGIRFSNSLPKPVSGTAGTEVVYQITGLPTYKDKMEFYLNDTKAEVLEVTDKTVKIKVPEGASSGGVTIIIDGQIFFGPEFTVAGKAGIDPTFKSVMGTDYSINQIMPLANGNLILVGAFTDYENNASAKQPINSIVSISADGQYIPSLASGAGARGLLTSMTRMSNGQYMIGGLFSAYNKRKSIGGITRLNANGSLDSTIVELLNLTPLQPKNSFDTVARFNGAVSGVVRKVFNYNNKVITVGSFDSYYSHFYERSTRDNKVIGFTKMNMLLRMDANGKLDSTYNFNMATGTSYEAANGQITDALMQDDGKVILVGSFTRFQGANTNYITRVDDKGLIDPTFQAGAGADGPIGAIRYNASKGKYMVTGSFKSFNGKAADGVVMMNKDGSVDESFKLGTIEGGNVGFSAQLSNGLILLTGSFKKYNGTVRQGFMLLNPDGTLAKGYNNTGKFQGTIADIYETTSALGFPAVLMVGTINKFDNKTVGNLVRFILRP